MFYGKQGLRENGKYVGLVGLLTIKYSEGSHFECCLAECAVCMDVAVYQNMCYVCNL